MNRLAKYLSHLKPRERILDTIGFKPEKLKAFLDMIGKLGSKPFHATAGVGQLQGRGVQM